MSGKSNKKLGYDGSGYPRDVKNFIGQFSDKQLADIIVNFVPGKRDSCLGGQKYSHHLDYELDTTDKLFHRFSIAPDVGGTANSLRSEKGKTKWVCELQIWREVFYEPFPDNFGALVRKGFLESMDTIDTTNPRAILSDYSLISATDKDIAAGIKRIEDEKHKPTHAPNGKPYWDFAKWGPPSTSEDYANYECTKPGDKKQKKGKR
ncbi:hypothetical protein B0J12DRAFT_702489 [Macrophomina phaseolina]|uniref:Uncharacterized protein n=1 Tax=Macrophomina phaseolina TaxID=35725 RepID=A0ABQ8G1G2_9PEZI|nr:hypothetical protein B0J12DRAFT_702489 [Macrophomina phaseolina]